MALAVRPQSTGRIDWVDTTKGIAIILVVIGHVIRGLVSARIMPHTPAEQFIDSWIYAFHMPLFFFLSGLFIPRSIRKSYPTFVEDKLRTIAAPYFVWSAITVVSKSFLSRFTNHAMRLSDGWRIIFEPIEQFWFLYALFLLVLVMGALLKLGLKPWMLIAGALLAHPALGPIPGGFWGPATQTRTFAIYLAMGIWFGSSPLAIRVSEVPSRWLATTAAIGFAVLTVMVGWNLKVIPTLLIVMAVIGSTGCLALAIDLSRRPNIVDALLRTCGLLSLEIFVAHTIASAGTRIALQKILHVQDPATHLILGILAGLIFPITLGLACERLRLDFVFTFRKPPRPIDLPAAQAA